MPDKDEAVNVNLDPEEALRLLLETEPIKPESRPEASKNEPDGKKTPSADR